MKIIVSAGGTGGHIYPALALVDYIKKCNPNTEFLFVGTTDRLESQIVPQMGLPYRGLHVKGLVGNPLQKAKNALIFLKSLKSSKKILKEFNPDIVIGFGGYPSASIFLAASQKGYKTMIHEQNSIIGLTNKILIKRVDEIICCYEKALKAFPQDKTKLLGNPRASVVSEGVLKDVHDLYNIAPDRKVMVIVMGSLGSATVNAVMKDALHKMDHKDYDVLYVTGKTYYEKMKEELKDLSDSIHVLPYIDDMPSVLHSCDLAVSRAGATTLAEMTALGTASIIIPSPYVVANHQEYNARELVAKGAAHLILEKDLNADAFVEVVDQYMNNEEMRKELSKKALDLGINFFDTANIYSNGEAEEILGAAIKKYAKREDVVIATKCGLNMDPNHGPNQVGLSRKHIFQEVEKSLKRLQTDYIDLYIVHRFDPNTPLEETMSALNDLVRMGKVRYIGASNFYAWQFAKAQSIAKENGWTQFISLQNKHNLFTREDERELFPLLDDMQVSLTPYQPLAGGRLSRRGETTSRSVSQHKSPERKYTDDGDELIVKRVEELADKYQCSKANIVLAYELSKSCIASVIVGTSSVERLEDTVKTLDVHLTKEDIHYLEEPYLPRAQRM